VSIPLPPPSPPLANREIRFRGSTSPELQKYRFKMAQYMELFNQVNITPGGTTEDLQKNRMDIAKLFIGKIGVGVNIPTPFFVANGFNLFLEDRVLLNRGYLFCTFPSLNRTNNSQYINI